jgi:hypothetical protein
MNVSYAEGFREPERRETGFCRQQVAAKASSVKATKRIMVSERIRCLLGVHPRIRTGQPNRHIRKENPQRLAVTRPAMVQGDKQRADLLVISHFALTMLTIIGFPGPRRQRSCWIRLSGPTYISQVSPGVYPPPSGGYVMTMRLAEPPPIGSCACQNPPL